MGLEASLGYHSWLFPGLNPGPRGLHLCLRHQSRERCRCQRCRTRRGAAVAKTSAIQRRAQFYVDFLVSANSMGFHADQYSVKSLAEAINFCREGQLSLRKKLSVSRGYRRPAEILRAMNLAGPEFTPGTGSAEPYKISTQYVGFASHPLLVRRSDRRIDFL